MIRISRISLTAALSGCLLHGWPAFAQNAPATEMTPVLKSTIKDHKGAVMSVAFTPDGKLLASGSWDKTVKLWTVSPDLQALASLDTPFVAGVSTLAFSPDGKTLAAAAWKESFVQRWEMSGRTSLPPWPLGSGSFGINRIAFSPDGSQLAAACSDKLARLMQVAEPSNVTPLQGHTHFVLSIAFSPDGRQVAAGGFTGDTIRRWETGSHQALAALKGDGSPVNTLAYSPDGNLLAVGTSAGRVQGYDAKTGGQLFEWTQWLEKDISTGSDVSAIAFSPDGRLLAVAGETGGNHDIVIFDMVTRQAIASLKHHQASVECVAFSPDGKFLASGSSGRERELCLWELSGGSRLSPAITAKASVPSPARSPPRFTGTKWSGGTGLSIEFRPDGHYREFWRGGEYPGAWKELSDQKVEVTRRDGWDYTYRRMGDGSLLREWKPKTGQPQQPDIVFRSLDKAPDPGASPAAAPPAPKTPAEALAVLRDSQRSPVERMSTLALITQQGTYAVAPLAEVLIAEVDRARQRRDQIHASGKGWGFDDDSTWELRRDMAAGIKRAAGADAQAGALAASVLAWTDWRDPSPGGVRAGSSLSSRDSLPALVPALKPLFAHQSSAVRAGAMRLCVWRPDLASQIKEEVWAAFAKADPVEKVAASRVLLEAGYHGGEVFTELHRLMQSRDSSLATAAAEALPVQGKAAESSARFLRGTLKVQTLRPLALKTLCLVNTSDQSIKQDLFLAALAEPMETDSRLGMAFYGTTPAGIQPLIEALSGTDLNARRRSAAIIENGYIMPQMSPEYWITMESRLPRLTPAFLPVLQHALDDTDAEVRCRAANTLALMGKDAASAAPALVRLLGDSERVVRWAAAWALENCSPGTAVAERTKAVADRPTSTGTAGDKLTLIGYDPPILPAILTAGTTFRVRVAYEMKSVKECLVFGTPLLNGSPAPDRRTNGSPRFSAATGEARPETYGPRNGGTFDQFAVYLSAVATPGKLAEIVFDAPVTWRTSERKNP